MKTVKFRVTEYIGTPFSQSRNKEGFITAEVRIFGMWFFIKDTFCEWGDMWREKHPFNTIEEVKAYLWEKYDTKPTRLNLVQMPGKISHFNV